MEPPEAALRVGGELDYVSARCVAVCLEEVLDAGCDRVTVDAGRVSFVDAGGLAVLLKYQRRVVAAGGSLEVHVASPRFVEVCHLANFEGLLAPQLRRPPA